MENILIKIPEHAENIIKKLQKNGFNAYVVGGCVRDTMQGKQPHDWDICTSALPVMSCVSLQMKRSYLPD